jgi:DNA-directed RNA polymerase II subunit RPB2
LKKLEVRKVELREKSEKNIDEMKKELENDIHEINQKITDDRVRKFYTHCELTSTAIMGFSSSLAPRANTQPGARTTYQDSMIRQALGIYNSNYIQRFDTSSKVLFFPTRPLFETNMNSLIGMDDLPAGEQVIVAVMPYMGYNQEDGIILNKGAADRGLFTAINFPIYTSEIINSTEYTEKFDAPVNITSEQDREKYALIGTDGLPEIGKYIKQGQAIINKVRTYSNGKKENIPELVGVIHEGVIARYFQSKTMTGEDVVKVKIEQRYIPGEGDKGTGDKFALRYSQKGTVTKILPEEQMPYIKGTNIRPDVIFSALGLPSRKTIGVVMEILLSKVAALKGEKVDATSFRNLDVDGAMKYLQERGMDPYGREILINPFSGKEIEVPILIGPAYYQVLKHRAGDKIQGRKRGAVQISTRQPVRNSSISKESGIKIGEMERDALLAHGVPNVIQDKLCEQSDQFEIVFCSKCGEISSQNVHEKSLSCNICKEETKFFKSKIPFPYKTLLQLVRIAGVNIKHNLSKTKDEENIFEDLEAEEN